MNASGKHVIAVTVPPRFAAAVAAITKSVMRSVSDLVRDCLRERVKAHGIDPVSVIVEGGES
jgi:hypothetical protein